MEKEEINRKLNTLDKRLGHTLFVEKSSVKPDGGIIEVLDNQEQWRIILVSEAKHQGKDIDNILLGKMVGKRKDQDLMVAGNAIERSHKNICEFRNLMIAEDYFPYVLFLQGSNFLIETQTITRPDGRKVVLKHDNGALNRIDRLTAANYSMPINTNSCKNLFIEIGEKRVMLQAVSIFTKAVEWGIEEMYPKMLEVAETAMEILKPELKETQSK